MVFSFSLGIRRAIDEALVRRFACLRAEIGSDGEGKEGVCNSSVRGLFVCEEEDFLASGGEQGGFLLLPQGRKASQWRDCDGFTRSCCSRDIGNSSRFSLVLSRIPVEIYCFKFVVLVLVGEGGTLCCCTEASGLSCYRSRIDSLVCRWGNERNLCWMHLDRGRFLLLLLRLLLHGITMSNLGPLREGG